jgi:hypothetical protein
VLAVGVNCFSIHESISDAICAAKQMTTLILDGLQTAPACRGSPMISIPALHYNPGTYTIPTTELAASIPKCIFQLPQLEVLQMSGNGLVGNIDLAAEGVMLSPQLTNLVLAHNYLTGPINVQIQRQSRWMKLDLSFNKFSGTLLSDMHMSNSAVNLSLGVNRLSGDIPSGLLALTNISILQGNAFNCPLSLARNAYLPVHDMYVDKFSCGSNEFNVSLIL